MPKRLLLDGELDFAKCAKARAELANSVGAANLRAQYEAMRHDEDLELYYTEEEERRTIAEKTSKRSSDAQ